MTRLRTPSGRRFRREGPAEYLQVCIPYFPGERGLYESGFFKLSEGWELSEWGVLVPLYRMPDGDTLDPATYRGTA